MKNRKKFKGILIDSKNETFTDVEVDMNYGKDGNNDVHRMLPCRTFTISRYDGADETSDTIFIDDNGLLNMKENTTFFYFAEANCVFVGNGIILGTDEEGNTVDVKHDIAFYKKQVTFHSLKEAMVMFPYVRQYYYSK